MAGWRVLPDGFDFSLLSNLFLSVSPSFSGFEQYQVLSIQNSYEAATSSEGSEMYVQFLIEAFSVCGP